MTNDLKHPNLSCARTILAQLGGNKFIVMTGAKNFIGSDNSLSFKIGANSKAVTHVHVQLDANDTYTMTFTRIRGTHSVTKLATISGLYFDQLQSTFTTHTGMLTKF